MVKIKTYTVKKKKWAAKRYKKRLQDGLCPMCGGLRTGEWITCEKCLAKARAYRKTKTRNRLKANRYANQFRNTCREEGICYGCGNYIGLGKYKKCERCREKDNKAKVEHYVLLCLQGGICVQCKSNIDVGAYRKCPPCRKKDRIRRAKAHLQGVKICQ